METEWRIWSNFDDCHSAAISQFRLHGPQRPHPLSRSRSAQPHGRSAHSAAGLGDGQPGGHHKSPLSGFAVEFAGHREYVAGDDPKHIDWRVYFTRDKYFIKQYEMETNFVCHLILDISASMRYGEADRAKTTVRGPDGDHARLLDRQAERQSLAGHVRRRRAAFVPPSNSMAQIVRMTEPSGRGRPVKKTRMAECLTELTGRMRRREIVMMFSDFFTDLDALESALQRMRYSKHEVVLFQMMHHDELAFEFDGMIKFLGLEIPRNCSPPGRTARAYLVASQEVQRGAGSDLAPQPHRGVLIDTSDNLGQEHRRLPHGETGNGPHKFKAAGGQADIQADIQA